MKSDKHQADFTRCHATGLKILKTSFRVELGLYFITLTESSPIF